MWQSNEKNVFLKKLFPQYSEIERENFKSTRLMNRQDKKIDNKMKKIIDQINQQNQTFDGLNRIQQVQQNNEVSSKRKLRKNRSFNQKNFIKKHSKNETTERSLQRVAKESKHNLSLPKIRMNKKKLEISKLNEREHELGHLVLKKVERHFDMEKNEGGKNKYYNRVKSQENIDDSLIQYLRTKVQKANAILTKRKN